MFWKAKPVPVPSGVSLASGKRRDIRLLNTNKGYALRLQESGPVRVEYVDLNGKATGNFDLGFQPAGDVVLPRRVSSRPGLLIVKTDGQRRIFMLNALNAGR